MSCEKCGRRFICFSTKVVKCNRVIAIKSFSIYPLNKDKEIQTEFEVGCPHGDAKDMGRMFAELCFHNVNAFFMDGFFERWKELNK